MISVDSTISEVVAVIEREIEERQAIVATLRALCAAPKRVAGVLGAPHKYDREVYNHVARLILAGNTHRDVATLLQLPVATVGSIAKRLGVRNRHTKRGGARTKGVVDHARKHRAKS